MLYFVYTSITIYKTLLGGGLEQNLSGYKNLIFNANATGAVNGKVTIVKKSVSSWNKQYSYTMALDGNREYSIPLSKFFTTTSSTAINANDITAVNFSFTNNRGVNTSMTMNLNNVRFSNANPTVIDNSFSVINVYPNPTVGGFAATFNSQSNQSLVLKVVEIGTGRVVKTQFINAIKGLNKQTIELGNTVSGNYVVTLEGDDMKYTTTKLVVSSK